MKYKMIKEIKNENTRQARNIEIYDHTIDRQLLRTILIETMTDTEDPDMHGADPKGYMENLFSGKLGQVSSLIVLIAKAEDERVGVAIAIKNDLYYHMTSLGVKRKYREQGIASHLMACMCGFMFEKKEEHLELHVHSMNFPALNLYKKFNFRLKYET